MQLGVLGIPGRLRGNSRHLRLLVGIGNEARGNSSRFYSIAKTLVAVTLCKSSRRLKNNRLLRALKRGPGVPEYAELAARGVCF